tara:strand:+ start:3612 stop:4067 length:456 start_codon:yes stop_codon:yes gene_type:complete
MILQNPITYLLDYYYSVKNIQKNKKYKNKNLNFFISNMYRKTYMNKKFNKVVYVYNPFSSFYLQRNIVDISKEEMITMMDEIDKIGIVNNPRFDLQEYYKNEPLSPFQFQSLKKYNYYDTLLFEYVDHKNRKKTFKDLEEHRKSKLIISFE